MGQRPTSTRPGAPTTTPGRTPTATPGVPTATPGAATTAPPRLGTQAPYLSAWKPAPQPSRAIAAVDAKPTPRANTNKKSLLTFLLRMHAPPRPRELTPDGPTGRHHD